MSKIHVNHSPLSNSIFAGGVSKKPPHLWLSNKVDVTVEALFAVAQHVLQYGQPVTLFTEDHKPRYRISVDKVNRSAIGASSESDQSSLLKESDKCNWQYDDHTESWDTECDGKWVFTDGGTPVDHGVKYCHSCGRVVDAAQNHRELK